MLHSSVLRSAGYRVIVADAFGDFCSRIQKWESDGSTFYLAVCAGAEAGPTPRKAAAKVRLAGMIRDERDRVRACHARGVSSADPVTFGEG